MDFLTIKPTDKPRLLIGGIMGNLEGLLILSIPKVGEDCGTGRDYPAAARRGFSDRQLSETGDPADGMVPGV